MNEYEILNIPETATREEIRAAYRDLARRWHPDRFMAGPERDWANERMAAINAAYRACLDGARQGDKPSAEGESEALLRVQALIDDGKYQKARKLLMGFDTRCAEWNYLFGFDDGLNLGRKLVADLLNKAVQCRIISKGKRNVRVVCPFRRRLGDFNGCPVE